MVRPLAAPVAYPCGDELRVFPAERREGDDARVEPDVAHLGDASHLGAALLAGDRHLVDPRPAQLLQLLDSRGRPLEQLGLRPDHVQVPAVARVERQRQSVVAPAGDVPVAHVPEPVVHALAHVGGGPLDVLVRLEQLRAQLVDRDQPVVGDPPDERRVAAPAMWVAMLVQPRIDQKAVLAEPADDLIGRLDRREPMQPAVRVEEPAGFVNRHQHGQVVDHAELEVLLPGAGRDVDDPCSLLERDLVPRDHAMLHLRAGPELVERPRVAPADELLAARPLDESLVGIPGDSDPLPVVTPAVLGVRLDGRGHVRRQRPGRRRPDHERLVGPVEQRQADEEGRVGAILVDARQRELVLGERGAAARAPLRRAVALVEPAALVDALRGTARRTRCSCR